MSKGLIEYLIEKNAIHLPTDRVFDSFMGVDEFFTKEGSLPKLKESKVIKIGNELYNYLGSETVYEHKWEIITSLYQSEPPSWNKMEF